MRRINRNQLFIFFRSFLPLFEKEQSAENSLSLLRTQTRTHARGCLRTFFTIQNQFAARTNRSPSITIETIARIDKLKKKNQQQTSKHSCAWFHGEKREKSLNQPNSRIHREFKVKDYYVTWSFLHFNLFSTYRE